MRPGGAALFQTLSLSDVRVEGAFWGPRLDTLRTVTLPTQHRLLEETGRIDNFRRAAGRNTGGFRGFAYNDSDVYKWIEATSYALTHATGENREQLQSLLAAVIDEASAAQRPDGYLNSYCSLDRATERFRDLTNQHELYCAGHLIEAAVAHHDATGERTLFDVAVRLADHICERFGPDGGSGTGGHPEIELALVRLYRTTGVERYLDRARFFLDQRGGTPRVLSGSEYHQDHLPVREQQDAAGHAVRLTYLASGMADVAAETDDQGLRAATQALWRSAFERKAYVTGALGSRYDGESFADDYELPNESAYAETCAAIGGMLWNWRMLTATGDARFADALETQLYNAVLTGISLAGERYFYANPLADTAGETPGTAATDRSLSTDTQQVDGHHRRQPWFACACCPTNIGRLLASLPAYVYGIAESELWVHLLIAGSAHARIPGRGSVALRMETDYPWSGSARLTIEQSPPRPFTLLLRIPGWAQGASIRVNAGDATPAAAGGYARVRRRWQRGDTVEIELPMSPRRIAPHPQVAPNAGRVALARGPIVYCLEAVDHEGVDPDRIIIDTAAPLTAEHRRDLLGGVTVLRGEGALRQPPGDVTPLPIMAIPYYAWANREPSAMRVWVRGGTSGAAG